MRAGYRNHPFPTKNIFSQPLRARYVRKSPLKDFLHQGIAARDDVANDENIRLERYLIHVPSINQLDAGSSELIAHRGVHVGVASGDAVAGRAREEREPAHEGATDAEDVQVH
ncbi:hypothetical protein D3C83_20110 [compost metagenome]